jgi:putative N6-adenine-specific DNA methylase
VNLDEARAIRITCARGLGEDLAVEVRALGFPVRRVTETTVETEGNFVDTMRLNLTLRTAFHVQLELASFRCPDADVLYEEVSAFPWEELLPTDGYFSVVSKVNTPTVTNSMFPSLKVKDAVVDRISEARGRRPDSGPRRDHAVLTLLWQGKAATLYLDTSGEKLSDRGYRRVMSKAPMRETLAAALLAQTPYDGSQPLVNPMCGSGTLAIEAALLGSGRAPGLLRHNFGLKHVLGFDAELWKEVRAEARAPFKPIQAPIVATDRDPRVIDAARKNAKTAGVDSLIQFEVCDFAETPVPAGEGVVILNPPYGKRLGSTAELDALYPRIGDFFKQRCQGYMGYVLTGDLKLAKRLGLRTKRRLPYFNGELECRLLEYELYGGSRKKREE